MKNKLAQIAYIVNKIDPRYIRFAYFVMMLGVGIIMQRPSDGGTDPI
jgi:hypothetical protein